MNSIVAGESVNKKINRLINIMKKKRIDYELIEPKKRKIVKKSYADNFLK